MFSITSIKKKEHKRIATNAKFKYSQEVKFKEGFYKGCKGIVIDSYWVSEWCSDMPAYDIEIKKLNNNKLLRTKTLKQIAEFHLQETK